MAKKVSIQIRVICICPSHRPEFLPRARACLEAQTYTNKHMFVLENRGECSIGFYRNEAIARAGPADLIAHWDDDDWSHPERLTGQVAFLEATGADVVGYQDMPFMDLERGTTHWYRSRDSKYALGTSLLYRRSLWERYPFPDQKDEDTAWLRALPGVLKRQTSLVDGVPRMVATIHKGNTSVKPRLPLADKALADAVKSCLPAFNVAQ